MTNQVIDCLMKHKSIRKFQDKMIPDDVVNTLLSAGIRAANGGNLQRYSFIKVDDKKIIEKLASADIFNNLYTVPLIIISIIDNYRLKRWFDINSAKYECINSRVDFYLSFYDAVIALHNVSIAAESLGLGTYYNGNVLEFDLYNLLNIPDYTFPVGLLCIGYPDKQITSRLSDRLPLEAVVHNNTYKHPTDEKISEWYQEKEYLFQNFNTKERLQELANNNIHNIAQAYASTKFSNAHVINERSNKIQQNIEKSKFKL